MIYSNVGIFAISHNRWKLNAVDGDKTVITVLVDSTLNSAAMALQPDVIVLVKSFCTVYFWYEDKGDGCCVIVIHYFEIVGHQHVPDKLNGKRPTGRLKVPAKKFTQHSVMKESGGFAAAGAAKICCMGSLCSKYSMPFCF